MSNDFIKDEMGTKEGVHLVSTRKRSFPNGGDLRAAFRHLTKMNQTHSMS